MRKATVLVLSGLFLLTTLARPAQAGDWWRRGRSRYSYHHHGHHGDGLAIVAGVLAGAIVLDLLTSPRTETVVYPQPVYVQPPVVYPQAAYTPPPVVYGPPVAYSPPVVVQQPVYCPPPVVYAPRVYYHPPVDYGFSITVGPYRSWRHPAPSYYGW